MFVDHPDTRSAQFLERNWADLVSGVIPNHYNVSDQSVLGGRW